MQVHTQAVVLSAIKYAEADLIVTCYTKSDGVKTYHIRGVLKSKKGKFKTSSFIPFTILDIVANHRNKGRLEYLIETKINTPLIAVHTDMLKSSLVMFLSEVVKSCIREEEANPSLFEFLFESIIMLDRLDSIANFHIYFMLELSKYLGFYPNIESKGGYFNLLEGVFQEENYSSNCIRTPASNVLFILINNSHQTLDYPMSKGLRKELVLLLLKYYQLHIEGFRQPRSLKVLEQLFK